MSFALRGVPLATIAMPVGGARVIEIREGGLDLPEVRALLHLDYLAFPPEARAEAAVALNLAGLRDSGTAFRTAWENGALLGCGALKRVDADHGVIKAIRAHPAHSRRGATAALLGHLLGVARARGMRRISLDTAASPDCEASLALYRQFGFTPCACAATGSQPQRYLARVL